MSRFYALFSKFCVGFLHTFPRVFEGFLHTFMSDFVPPPCHYLHLFKGNLTPLFAPNQPSKIR